MYFKWWHYVAFVGDVPTLRRIECDKFLQVKVVLGRNDMIYFAFKH